MMDKNKYAKWKRLKRLLEEAGKTHTNIYKKALAMTKTRPREKMKV